MARASHSTQTASGAKTVSVSDNLPTGDLLAELEQAMMIKQRQRGEYTRDELLAKCGSDWLLRKYLKENKKRIELRQCGPHEWFYRLK